jgi:hypothetical protein
MIRDKSVADKMANDVNSGYWKVDDCFFFDKAECLRYASQINNTDVTFHFFDDFYKAIRWDSEPSESLEELYKIRAQQIRDKYDYVVIAYSGGVDSCTVIDSFLNNGLHVDEIITSYPIKAIDKLYSTFDKNNKSASNLMFEYTEAAKPKLDFISRVHPRIKITVLDYTEDAIEIIGAGNLHKLPVAGWGAAPSLAGHHLIGKRLRDLSDRGSVAMVAGIDKPRMGYSHVSKKFGVWFDDVSTCWGHYNDYAFAGFSPKTEYFYYTQDLPELWQKQCMILKRAMEPIMALDRKPEFYKQLHFKSANGNDVFYVHDIFFKNLLYENWDPLTFQAGKPTSFFYQESADWYTKSSFTTQREKDFHIGQVNEMISTINNNFIDFDENGRPLQFKNMSTRPIGI